MTTLYDALVEEARKAAADPDVERSESNLNDIYASVAQFIGTRTLAEMFILGEIRKYRKEG